MLATLSMALLQYNFQPRETRRREWSVKRDAPHRRPGWNVIARPEEASLSVFNFPSSNEIGILMVGWLGNLFFSSSLRFFPPVTVWLAP